MSAFKNLKAVEGQITGWKYEGQGLPDEVLVRLGRAGLLAKVETTGVPSSRGVWRQSSLVIVNDRGEMVARIHGGEYVMFRDEQLFPNDEYIQFEEV